MKERLVIIVLFVMLISCACSNGHPGYPIIDPNEWCHFSIHAYDQTELPPVEVRAFIHVVSVHADDVLTAHINWGDGNSDELLTRTSSAEYGGSHMYQETGEYLVNAWITLRDGTSKGPYGGARHVSIGPPIRDYVDLGSGGTIQIYDGIVVVTFNDWERLSQLEGDIADDPEVAAFLTAEGARSNAEWSSVAAIQVVLPYNLTVEEAVSEWPTKYPDLIYGVDPVYLIPLGE